MIAYLSFSGQHTVKSGHNSETPLNMVLSSPPTDRLHRAGIDRILAVAGAALARTDHLGLFIDYFKYPGTNRCAVAAADAGVLIHDRHLCHESSFFISAQSS
jgi:hypothetical protein